MSCSGSTIIPLAARAAYGPPAQIRRNPSSATASVARKLQARGLARARLRAPRQQLPAVPTWTSVPGSMILSQDPLSEKYYSISPYAYCAGNPVNLVAPDGMEIWVYLNRGRENEQALRYESGALFNTNGDLYDGDDSFARRVLTSLYIIDSIIDDDVSYVMSKLISSPRRHIIEKDPGNDDATGVVEKAFGKSLAHSGIPVEAVIHVSLNKKTIENNLRNTPTATLGHELMHAFDYDQGNFKGMIGRPKSVYDVDPMEIRAVYFENLVRKNRGLPIRMTYGGNIISKSSLNSIKIR